ncbi:Serine incorporator, partial [Globisporangium splendens]
MGCFFLTTGLLSCAVARGCENVCCLTLFQIPFYFGMLFCSLFIPNSRCFVCVRLAFFDDYAGVARIASAAFMIIQIIIILDYACTPKDYLVPPIDLAIDLWYNARDFILDKMDEAERDDDARQALLDTSYETVPDQSETAYLAVVVGTTAAATVAIVIMYKKYAGCDLNTAFITITVLSCIVLTFMSACSSADPSTMQHQTKSVALNAALAAFTITWTSWRISMTKTNLFSLSSLSSSLSNDLENEETGGAAGSKGDKKKQVVVPEYQFHALMFLASFYMAMVITNWGSSNGLASEGDEFVTMWVKIGSQWVAIALFLWTLIAPSVLPDRDFGV